jgi:hypothetical protein
MRIWYQGQLYANTASGDSFGHFTGFDHYSSKEPHEKSCAETSVPRESRVRGHRDFTSQRICVDNLINDYPYS